MIITSAQLGVGPIRSKELQARDSGAGSWEFHPVASARAHEAVVEQITFAIRAGAFASGDRLPPIDSLSRTMKVSKPVIGEALKVLSRAGVLRVQRGINGGQTVLTSEIPGDIMALSAPDLHLSVPEILEARRPVEIQLSVLAGERATEADFELLDGCIQRLRSHCLADLEQRIRFDHLFHYNIGRAARSRALAQFQHQILEQLFLKLRHYFEEIEDINGVIALHEETLAALRTRKKTSIERAIDRHLQPLEQAVTRADQGTLSSAAP